MKQVASAAIIVLCVAAAVLLGMGLERHNIPTATAAVVGAIAVFPAAFGSSIILVLAIQRYKLTPRQESPPEPAPTPVPPRRHRHPQPQRQLPSPPFDITIHQLPHPEEQCPDT